MTDYEAKKSIDDLEIEPLSIEDLEAIAGGDGLCGICSCSLRQCSNCDTDLPDLDFGGQA
ncbi:MAG: hypothetical protein AAF772_04390 [Acidobacteriota bacterium]